MQDLDIQKISEGVITDGPATPELWVLITYIIGTLLILAGLSIISKFWIIKYLGKNTDEIIPIKKCFLLIGFGCLLFTLPLIYQILYEILEN